MKEQIIFGFVMFLSMELIAIMSLLIHFTDEFLKKKGWRVQDFYNKHGY